MECEDSLDLSDGERMPVGRMSGGNQLFGTGEIEMRAFIGDDAVGTARAGWCGDYAVVGIYRRVVPAANVDLIGFRRFISVLL